VRQILTDGCAASGTPIDIKFSPGSYSPPREITVRVLKQEAAPYREIKVPAMKIGVSPLYSARRLWATALFSCQVVPRRGMRSVLKQAKDIMKEARSAKALLSTAKQLV
jgi:hypothetical protein